MESATLCIPVESSLRTGSPVSGPAGYDTAFSSTKIRLEAGQYRLYHNGRPYYIKGVGGERYLEAAAAAGANSVRTWGAQAAGSILEKVRHLDMSVLVGIWLSHDASHYLNEDYKSKKMAEVREVVERYKGHPALLMWSLGNEINLQGAGTPQAWQYVNQLVGVIRALDPNHPVITVIAYDEHSLDQIARYAPDLDAIGINAYRAVSGVRRMVETSAYKGPYLITEWGVDGYWEVAQTAWGSPIEPTSAQKALHYHDRYSQDILANRDRCLGSYVFLWGQKQERTSTWFSMFIDDIPGLILEQAACPTVEVMRFNWSGAWPANRAPEVTHMTVNLGRAHDNITLSPDEPLTAEVAASDPDRDTLTYLWEVLEKPGGLGAGGAHEARPRRIGSVETSDQPTVTLRAPAAPGCYRLFVYVFDEKGHVGTANVPFRVDPHHTGFASNPG